jgi:hypothetical protein
VYKVKLTWKLGQDTDEWWNQACAWVMENYGLPGMRYSTELTEDYMIFNFKEKEDAAMTALRWGNN